MSEEAGTKAVADLGRQVEEATRPKKKEKGFLKKLWGKIGGDDSDSDDGTDPYGLSPQQRERFQAGLPMLEERAKLLLRRKEHPEASKVFEQAGTCSLLLGDRKKASENYLSAGNASLSAAVDAEEEKSLAFRQRHVSLVERAIDEAGCGGHYSLAADWSLQLSQFLNDRALPTYNPKRAQELLRQAGKYYVQAGETQNINTAFSELAETLVKQDRYLEAAEFYRQCCENCTEVSVLRLCSCPFAVKSMLCRVAAWPCPPFSSEEERNKHADELEDAFASLCDLDPSLTPVRREHMFIRELIEGLREGDSALLTKALRKYKEVHPIDDMQRLMVRRAICVVDGKLPPLPRD